MNKALNTWDHHEADAILFTLCLSCLTQITLTPISTGIDDGAHVQDVIRHSSDEVFAKDKDGKIYRIRAPENVGFESFSVFGCKSVGGGMRAYNGVSRGSGVSGEKTIRYPAKYVSIEYSQLLWPCPSVP